MWELSKTFRFDAAHTLERAYGTEGSRRIHGHSYRAMVTVRGTPDSTSGMIVDLAAFEEALKDAHEALDHMFLDEIEDLGPATMENLSKWIWDKVAPVCPGLTRVTVYRDSHGEECVYFGPKTGASDV